MKPGNLVGGSSAPPNFGPAVELIKRFEGFRSAAYRDPVGVWTIGWGTTAGVFSGQICTQAQATAWLYADVDRCAERIRRFVDVPLTDNQLCALISLSYNIGLGALQYSTLLKQLNAGKPKAEVAANFGEWDHAGGRVLPGLVRRREAERELFLKS